MYLGVTVAELGLGLESSIEVGGVRAEALGLGLGVGLEVLVGLEEGLGPR